MVSLFNFDTDEIRILDPGAGNVILFAACINEIIKGKYRYKRVKVVAYDKEEMLEHFDGQCYRTYRRNTSTVSEHG